MTGVPLHQLRCPTCGQRMSPVAMWEAPESFVTTEVFAPCDAVRLGRPYLTCDRGHRWTIKELTRSINRPDEVLLGNYIGED